MGKMGVNMDIDDGRKLEAAVKTLRMAYICLGAGSRGKGFEYLVGAFEMIQGVCPEQAEKLDKAWKGMALDPNFVPKLKPVLDALRREVEILRNSDGSCSKVQV